MRILRKYGNRRLYDTTDSKYVNLDDLAAIIRRGEDIRVVDASTEADLTREVLLQVVLDLHGGLDFLPPGLLRRIIRATGDDPAQRLLRQQLTSALSLLHDQLDRWEAAFGNWMGARPPPPAPTPPPPSERAAPPEPTSTPPAEAPRPPTADDDLVALRDRLARLEAQLNPGKAPPGKR